MSLSAIQKASEQIQGIITSLLTNSNGSYSALSKPIVDAVKALVLSVDFSAVVNAINSQNPIYSFKTATKFTANPAANTSADLIPANPLRRGMTIYNNSTNSLYVCIEKPAVAANLIGFCATNAGPTSLISFFGPGIYTGLITCIRNAGTGGVTAWEFT